MNSSRMGRLLSLLLVGVFALAACGPGGGGATASGGKLSVLATWTGSEQESFLAMIKPFTDRTGIKVDYTGTRDLNAVLSTRVQAGNPPDLVGIPGPGVMIEQAKAGKLKPLDNVVDLAQMKDQYAESWIKLGQVDGKMYGIFIKAALKGLIWYNPKAAQAAGLSSSSISQLKTWDQLITASNAIKAAGKTPWCVGLESGGDSGWPGTDWLEDIIMRQSGPKVYEDWYKGKQKWSSPEIKKAWQTWGTIVADQGMIYGGKNFVLTTAFGDAGNPMFTNPPKCFLHHQASFITDFFVKANPNLKPAEDFNFFGFPDIDPQYAGTVEAAGDLFGMFKDTPQARQMIKYLTTPEAQQIWISRGGALSPNKKVPLDKYPDPLAKQAGQILTSAKVALFDGSDQMPDAMNKAFFKGILDYINDPSKLDSILARLDGVQADSYK